MKLVVMIPAYNEEGGIGSVIREIPRDIPGIDKVEVLVVNDGSSDNTAKVALDAGADKVVSNFVNSGVGKSFRVGLDNSLKMGADIIVNIDADRQFNPQDIPEFVKYILNNDADVVIGSRFLDPKMVPKMPTIKRLGNHIFTKLLSFLTNYTFTDTQCGFRAFSRLAAINLTLFAKFTYTQEVLLNLVTKDFRIEEIPINVHYFTDRNSRVVKNPINYGINSMIIIIRSIRDIKPLLFFGAIGGLLFSVGFIFGLVMFVRWLFTGATSPYTSLIIFSSTFLIIGFLLIILALIADLVGRNKKLLEEIAFYNRILYYGHFSEENEK